MAFNNQEQEIIRWGLQNGKSRQEVEGAISNYRSGYIPPKQEQPTENGLGRVASTYGKNLKEQFLGGVENAQKTFIQGVDTMQQAQQMPTGTDENTTKAIAKATAGAGQIGVGAMSGVIQTAFSPITAAILTGVQGYKELDEATGGTMKNQITQIAQSNPELIKSISDYIVQNPKKAQFATDMLNVLTVGVGGKPALEATQNLTRGAVNTLGDVVDTGAKLASSGVDVGGQVLSKTVGLKDTIRKTIATSNASPQLKSSAERMFMEGAGRVGNPLTTYESYLLQSKNAVKDIKAEPAVSSVGADIGSAFEKVVKQRKAVGEVMGEELKSLGNIRVPVNTTGFLAQLKDSGLTLNPKTGQLTSFQGTRFAPDEIAMLQSFTDSALKLGNNPTVSQIDNFIAKTRSELEFTKGRSGVMGTTNAERIINGALREMKEGLNPANNGITELSSYWNANKAYEDLSNFLEEGQSYLGKKTQTGDFAKDASLAKSSVQSILNNGKKDWLVRLEELTGEPLLDKAVLALQAMKDAGDFRGTSLLQTLSDGGVPVTKSGLVDRILGYVATKGGEVVAGTPEEQTRLFLQSLIKSEAKNKTTIPTTKPKAKAGDSANKTNQSNNFIQPNSTTKEGVVNELINNPLRGSVTPSEFLPKKKVGSEDKILYHGTANDLTNFDTSKIGSVKYSDWGKGIYLTPSKSSADYYRGQAITSDILKNGKLGKELKDAQMEMNKFWKGSQYDTSSEDFWKAKAKVGDIVKKITEQSKSGGFVKEVSLDKSAKLYRHNVVDGQPDPNLAENLKLKEKGFDGIEIYGSPNDTNPEEVILFNSDKIKIKNTPKVATSLEQEAKKYKSAEDFVKAISKKEFRYDDSVTSNATIGEIPLSRFDGNDIRASQNTVDRAGVKKWEDKIKSGERPYVLVRKSFRDETVSVIGDGHTRLTAYQNLGIKNIPVIDNSGGVISGSKSQLTDIWKKANKK